MIYSKRRINCKVQLKYKQPLVKNENNSNNINYTHRSKLFCKLKDALAAMFADLEFTLNEAAYFY